MAYAQQSAFVEEAGKLDMDDLRDVVMDACGELGMEYEVVRVERDVVRIYRNQTTEERAVEVEEYWDEREIDDDDIEKDQWLEVLEGIYALGSKEQRVCWRVLRGEEEEEKPLSPDPKQKRLKVKGGKVRLEE